MLKRGVFLIILTCCSLGLCASSPNIPPVSQTNTPAITPANTPPTAPIVTSVNTQPAQPQISPANPTPPTVSTADEATRIERDAYKQVIEANQNTLRTILSCIATIGGLILALVGYMVFKSKKDYDEAVRQAKEAKEDAKDACKEARQWEKEARAIHDRVDKQVAEELAKITVQAAETLKQIKQQGEELIRELLEKAKIERQITELWNEALKLTREYKYDEAISKYNELVKIQPNNCDTYNNLGAIYQMRGELDKAEEMYNKTLEVNQLHGQKEEIDATAYGNLGIIHQIRGEPDVAMKMFNKSLDIYQQIGQQIGTANQYCNLGNVYKARGDLDKAVEMYSKALEIHQQLELQEGVARQYTNLGIVYNIRGELNKALDMYKKALEINQRLGRQEGKASQTKIKTFEELYTYFEKNKKWYLIETLPSQDGNPMIAVSLLGSSGKPLTVLKPKPKGHEQLSRYIFRGVEVSQPKLLIPKVTIEAIIQILLLPPDIFELGY